MIQGVVQIVSYAANLVIIATLLAMHVFCLVPNVSREIVCLNEVAQNCLYGFFFERLNL